MSTQATEAISLPKSRSKTVFPVLLAVSLCHLLNDMTQALLPAVYPILRGNLDLSFAQVGFLTFVYQITGSLLQPFIGLYTDRRRMPYSLPFGMASSMAGLLTIAFAPSYAMLLVGSMLLGLGSSIFHPESSRIARLASGGSHGLAQSLFQVGGNFGAALGPLAAAFIVLPRGQSGLAWFALATLAGIIILTGRSDNVDRVRGLFEGADAYLTKPVEIDVLVATLYSVARRLEPAMAPAGHWALSPDEWFLLSPSGGRVMLSKSERLLLEAMFQHANEVVSREALIAVLTDDVDAFDPHRLDSMVHRLRRKVLAALGEPLPLNAAHGTGYVLET